MSTTPRLPDPLTPDGLRNLMRERPYWDLSHPRSPLYRRLVDKGFEILYPGPARYGPGGHIDTQPLKPQYVAHLVEQANREMEELERGFDERPSPTGGAVHVQPHTRDGGKVEVSDYWRSRPGEGSDAPKPRNLLDETDSGDEADETSDTSSADNREFLDQISKAEQSFDKPDGGYGDHNPVSNELGRYQMKPSTLEDIKWRNSDGTWTNEARKHGVESDPDFLKNPEAQEAAANAMVARYEEQATKKGLYNYVGQKIDGVKEEIEITEAGIIAAVHAEGATGTKDYLEKVKAAGYRSKDLPLTDNERRVETRLRTFQDVPYNRVSKQ